MFQSRLKFTGRYLCGVQPKGSSECPGRLRGGGGSHPNLQLTSAVGGLSHLLGYKYMGCRKEPKDVLFPNFRFLHHLYLYTIRKILLIIT